MKTFAEKVMDFYDQMKPPTGLPTGVEVLNPYVVEPTKSLKRLFMEKFFSDSNKRILIIGINPGRLGGGLTGVDFTDPIHLQEFCGIPNDLPRRHEISSEFIYEMIAAFGGPEKFYSQFFLTAASPLGLIKDGVNYNYYDDQKTLKATSEFIVTSLKAHIDFGAHRHIAIVLGSENLKHIVRLNAEHGFFDDLICLHHPRYIMQYRRKSKGKYVESYLGALHSSLKKVISA